MIRITKQEKESLESVGLIRYRIQRGNRIYQDSNLVVTNREHVGKNSKTYYVVEEPAILKYLGYYDTLNLQRINDEQYETLVAKGLLNEDRIQRWGEYKPDAVCYFDQFGEKRITKVAQLMIALGLWRTNKQKKIDRDRRNSVDWSMDNALSNAIDLSDLEGGVIVGFDGEDMMEVREDNNEFAQMFKHNTY